MKKATLRATASAFALLGSGVAAATMVAAPAAAQDYTSAALSGTVQDEGGNAISGATVQLVSLDLGFTRTATTGANGGFRYSAVPAGNYDLVVSNETGEVYRAEGLRLLASQNANVDVVIPGGLATEEAIVVQGSSLLNDFEGTTLGLNVDVEELVKTVPIGRDLTSVVLLAPGTTQGDSAFGNLASIGGSSVAENAYYLNGLNITNFDNYLGSARVPFDMYRSVEVKSGGYPAEFGRATGGIVNAVTKSGSNDFFGALHLNWAPDWLRSNGRDLITCDSDGTCENSTNRDEDRADSYSAILEAGGPVIRDHLFLYGLVEFREVDTLTVAPRSGSATQQIQDDPFWGLKVDAIPFDGHQLEFTIFDTRRKTEVKSYDYSETNGMGVVGGQIAESEANFGGVNYVAKYTGNLTDFLTISGAYGKMRDRFDNRGIGASATNPWYRNLSGGTFFDVPFGGYYTEQRTATTSAPYNTEREFYRADVDLFFNAFGDHHIRAGWDREINTLTRSSVRTGGDFLLAAGFMTQAAYDAGSGGAGIALVGRAPNASGNPLVELNYFNSGGAFDSTNTAFYIQDEWDITDRLTLNLGLRNDKFEVERADGEILTSLDDNWAPRLGFTYDLWPEQNGKLYGFYGTYFLPVASNTAFRMAGSEFFFRERFEVLGIDSNGLPILGDQVTDLSSYQSTCPFALSTVSSGQNCSVTGNGSVPPTDALIASNLEATKETEWLVGYEHDFGDFQVGISYINRRLDRTAEDSAIDLAVLNYCDEQGIVGCESIWTGFHQYTIWNPGGTMTVVLDGDALCDTDPRACAEVTFTADELGYPAAVRKYDAVELTARRPWDGNWSLSGSYTWSKSRGNTEGLVQSDFGQDDAGITQDFDQPGFTDFSYGNLPNDRRHRFKLFGAARVIDELIVGANLSLESPRPLSCFGFHPTDVFGNLYGAASHYCGLQPAPRGEGSETDWLFNADMSLRYGIDMGDDRQVTLRADIFNIFNSQNVTSRNEFGDLDIDTQNAAGEPTAVIPNPNYDNVTSYQAPRAVRLGLDITF
ncbi:TonB-dependent receptor [Sphingomicrobium clamense]|uniref:TonB-dependent receptor n=1 Tax=Sphingomicrobium clamense TaxID=2851013 RepID=A0ABS6V3P6_9SPHN|nr:TonB-dependent receptor [Sphingomicrobium sp. B8]MBW0144180.1 TonB-dependent receptor [Sphingomicrobium sp. B8]